MESHNVVLAGSRPARTVASLIDSWGVAPIPVTCDWEEIPGGVRFRAFHEGYAGVKLSRQIEFQFRRGWTVRDCVDGFCGQPHIQRWHFEYGVEIEKSGKGYIAAKGKACLAISFLAKSELSARAYRNEGWMPKSVRPADEPAPWVLDIQFGGGDHDCITTDFHIVPKPANKIWKFEKC